MARPRKRYDDKFRASAVVMLEAAGYPDKKGAMTQVAKHLGVPMATLNGWFKASRNPPPAELRTEKRGDLVALIREELGGILEAMPNARMDASFRDLAVATGILVDKLQLLTGAPTENSNQSIRIIRDKSDSIRLPGRPVVSETLEPVIPTNGHR